MSSRTGRPGSSVAPWLPGRRPALPTLLRMARRDTSCNHGLALWCVSDNLRKGAALNVVQTAEELIRRDLLCP